MAETFKLEGFVFRNSFKVAVKYQVSNTKVNSDLFLYSLCMGGR